MTEISLCRQLTALPLTIGFTMTKKKHTRTRQTNSNTSELALVKDVKTQNLKPNQQ